FAKDGKEYEAEVLARDPFEDVAFLKIKGDGVFKAVDWANSDDLRVGERVLAIGNALAKYKNTVTAGIVSAKDRSVSTFMDYVDDRNNYYGLIQTDAAINMGNSGGPLVNLNGEVVGMSTAYEDGGQGIGFAIPSNDLKSIIAGVVHFGEIVRPVLGVSFVMLTEAQAQDLSPDLLGGALIAAEDGSAVVDGLPADLAGLKDGDVVLKVDSRVVGKSSALNKIIKFYEPGDEVVLNVWRGGEYLDLVVELGNSKDL
ncbi:trypsin-like peptidase domain-containing protein, partial [Patescibacteria group bacterium]|nr:trypsin-like peptidase domain-containing protein [Patescibacteria group bacterium]